MRPLIYTNRWYLLVFCMILVFWGILEGLGPLRWRGSPEAQRQDRGSLSVLAWSFLFGISGYFLLPLWFPWSTIAWNQPLTFFMGTVLVIIGWILRWSAIHTLGRYFTTNVTISTDHQVVQHGLYRVIRHPSYTGVLVSVMGMGLMMTNWASACALTAGLLVGLLYRIAVEERVLKAFLGQSYVAYTQRVRSRLLPFVF